MAKNPMWNKILTMEAMAEVAKLSNDEAHEVSKFFMDIQQKTDYKTVVMMAIEWKTYDEDKQTRLACATVGDYQASRFLALLDYLSVKFWKGELK